MESTRSAREKLIDEVERKIPLFEERSVYLKEKNDGSKIPKPNVENAVDTAPKDFDYVDQENFKAIAEVDSDEAISVVSKRYTLVQIRDSFRSVLEFLPEETNGRIYYHSNTGRAGMKLFPDPERNTGLWVMDGVNAGTAVRVDFMQETNKGTVFAPKDIGGYKKIHRGEVEQEFKNYVETLNEVKDTWETIINEFTDKEANDDDIEAINNIVGENAADKINDWLEDRKINRDGTRNLNWRPNLWQLMKKAIKLVSSRNYTTGLHREERLRQLSSNIFAYALKA